MCKFSMCMSSLHCQTSRMAPKKVMVIGAGPGGLCTLRHMAQYPDDFSLTSYEKNKDIGGLWNYSDDTKTDEYGLPTCACIYKTMMVNLPKEVMQFTDFPFPDELPSFPHHTEVKKYLTNYTEHFNLRKFIKFQMFVTEVKPRDPGRDQTTWSVTSRNLVTNEITTAEFDIVVVSNGSENVPNWPAYPGEDTFKGELLHSKHFRDPADYRGKVVLVLGGSFSAPDTVFEIAPFAQKIYLSHRRVSPIKYKLPDNVQEVSCIRELVPDGAILQNGQHVEADVIIYATGYHYDFPFLSAGCGVTWVDDRVRPLYRHVISIRHPTLVFIGIMRLGLPLQMIDIQAHYACAVLLGIHKLPSEAEMLADEEKDYQERIVAFKKHPKKTHELLEEPLWDYGEMIARDGGFKTFTPATIKLFDYFFAECETDLHNMKSRNFRLIGDHDYEELKMPD